MGEALSDFMLHGDEMSEQHMQVRHGMTEMCGRSDWHDVRKCEALVETKGGVKLAWLPRGGTIEWRQPPTDAEDET